MAACLSSICAATLRAQCSHSVSIAKSANLSNGAPDWRAPKNSPGPRISRSRRAISNPSLVSTIALRRALAVSPSRAASPVDYSSTQADAAAPRPTTDTAYTWWSNRGQAYAKNVGWRLDYSIRQKTYFNERAVKCHARSASDWLLTFGPDY